jgi:hypothetical protein
MSSSPTGLPTPEGPGSVSGAPNLPEGFTDTFSSRYVDTGELRQHVVTGGEGPPLLLVMPALTRDFSVVVPDQLVTGREEIYFGWQFASKAAKKLPGHAVSYYVNTLASGPEALHASFAIYRGLDTTIAQNQQRKTRRLTLPVLGIGGAYSLGEQVADTMKLAADNVQTLVIPGCAHWAAEETPEETLAALTTFLAPYRDGAADGARRRGAGEAAGV